MKASLYMVLYEATSTVILYCFHNWGLREKLSSRLERITTTIFFNQILPDSLKKKKPTKHDSNLYLISSSQQPNLPTVKVLHLN